MPSAFLQLDRRRVMKTAMAISAGCVVTRIGAAGHIGPAPGPLRPTSRLPVRWRTKIQPSLHGLPKSPAGTSFAAAADFHSCRSPQNFDA